MSGTWSDDGAATTGGTDDLARGLRAHAHDLRTGLDMLGGDAQRLAGWGRRLAETALAGGRLLVAGNGGSAAEAQHLTAELVGRFEGERLPLSAIALHAETSSLTAIANDYGVQEMFARQVAAHGRPGDVLLLLSTSGESPNVTAAARAARELGVTTWALTGPGPCTLADLCDDVLAVQGSSTSAVQELHLVAVHALCAAVDAHVRRVQGQEPADEPDDRPLVAVVGDVVLDRDVDGQVTRFSPDGPVPVVDTLGVRHSPGGAGLTALLAADAARVVLVAPFGRDQDAAALRRALDERVRVVALPQDGTTRRKTRVRSAGQTIVRVDDGGPAAPVDVPGDDVRAALAAADVVLVSDYGAGTTHDPVVRDALTEAARDHVVVWDPHPRGGPPVPGTTVVTPNLAEAVAAAEALGLPAGGDDPGALAQHLAHAWQVGEVCVTVGATGAYLARSTGQVTFVPADPAAGDPCGAGDRFASALACRLVDGGTVRDAVPGAVATASAWVAAGGADAYRRRAVDAPLPAAAPATGPSHHLADVVARLGASGGTVVATGGCFDLLHAGHVATLEAAARLGDHLVVLLNSDASVRRLKGPERPVVGQDDRARVLAALDCVSEVVVFDEDDPRTALESLRPGVWVKGGDYGEADLPEAEVVRRHGGRVVVLPYVEGRSTTSILRRAGGPAVAASGGRPQTTVPASKEDRS